jgi:hypothetical protein
VSQVGSVTTRRKKSARATIRGFLEEARALLALTVAGALLCAVGPPDRPLERVRLVYDRGAGAERCLNDEALRAEVTARLGANVFEEPAERILTVRLGRGRPGSLTAVITLTTSAGEALGKRELSAHGEDCAELAAALALELSIAIDPLGRARAKPPQPPPPSPPAPAPPAAPPPPVPTDVVLGAGAALVAGLSPGAAAAFRVSAELRRPAFAIGIEGLASLPSQVSAGGGQVSASVLAAALVPCARWHWTSGCALIQAGEIDGGSSGLDNPRQAHTPYVAVGARAQLDIPVHPLVTCRVTADLLAQLVQTTLTVGTTPAWTSSPVGGGLALGVAIKLP